MASVASSRTLSTRANGTTTWDEMSARFNVFNELIPMDSAVRQLVDDSRDTFKPCWHLLSKEAQNAVVDQVQAASDEVKSKLKVWSQGVRTDTVRKAFRRVLSYVFYPFIVLLKPRLTATDHLVSDSKQPTPFQLIKTAQEHLRDTDHSWPCKLPRDLLLRACRAVRLESSNTVDSRSRVKEIQENFGWKALSGSVMIQVLNFMYERVNEMKQMPLGKKRGPRRRLLPLVPTLSELEAIVKEEPSTKSIGIDWFDMFEELERFRKLKGLTRVISPVAAALVQVFEPAWVTLSPDAQEAVYSKFCRICDARNPEYKGNLQKQMEEPI
ncbi:hypothetical protein JCM5350_007442, partial [Sporobolomyces pararoseus]